MGRSTQMSAKGYLCSVLNSRPWLKAVSEAARVSPGPRAAWGRSG
jgi:hypothetical protein